MCLDHDKSAFKRNSEMCHCINWNMCFMFAKFLDFMGLILVRWYFQMENIFIGAWRDKRGISVDDVSSEENHKM